MRLQLMKLLGIILLLAGLVTALVPGVGAQGEVTWWWKDTDVGTDFTHDSHTADKYMTQTSPTKTTSDKLDLAIGNEGWWYAENAAQIDLSFPAGYWDAVLYTYTWGATVSTTVTVWNLHPDGSTTKICENTLNITATSAGTKFTASMTAGQADFSANDRVAMSVKVNSGGTLRLYYDATGRPAKLESPASSPAYPVPELPTIILIFLGLLLLGGYIWLKRRRKSGELLSC